MSENTEAAREDIELPLITREDLRGYLRARLNTEMDESILGEDVDRFIRKEIVPLILKQSTQDQEQTQSHEEPAPGVPQD